MPSATATTEPIPPQAIVMQMAMGALVTKVIAEATRLNIPDLVKRHGPMSAEQLIAKGGFTADRSAVNPPFAISCSALIGPWRFTRSGMLSRVASAITLVTSAPMAICMTMACGGIGSVVAVADGIFHPQRDL